MAAASDQSQSTSHRPALGLPSAAATPHPAIANAASTASSLIRGWSLYGPSGFLLSGWSGTTRIPSWAYSRAASATELQLLMDRVIARASRSLHSHWLKAVGDPGIDPGCAAPH